MDGARVRAGEGGGGDMRCESRLAVTAPSGQLLMVMGVFSRILNTLGGSPASSVRQGALRCACLISIRAGA